MTLKTLIVRYAIFALFATLVNLAAQRVVLHFGESGIHFTLALGLGTIFGLIIKYLLDKRWIFYDLATSYRDHSKKFILYTATGIITTAMFWTTETAFWLIWRTDLMRELGAIIGLSIGYVVKYNLDRRFVFIDLKLRGAT